MAIEITAAQRDALYAQIVDHLGALDDVRIAVGKEDFATAERLAARFADELRLVSEDLGWGEGDGQPVELSCPPELLRRVFSRFGEEAAELADLHAREQQEVRELEQRGEVIAELCRAGLAALPEETP